VPDLPPEEGLELEKVTHKNDLDLIYLLAPTSTGERISTVAARSRGFIYLVSLTGVTGARNSLSPELKGFVKRVRDKTDLPLCVGFGISKVEHALEAAALADGVIIGSKLIELIEQDTSLKTLKSFVASVRKALDAEKYTGEV
jgi:tryptophan synthase alpha chain